MKDDRIQTLPICQIQMEWKARALAVGGLDRAEGGYTFLRTDKHVPNWP